MLESAQEDCGFIWSCAFAVGECALRGSRGRRGERGRNIHGGVTAMGGGDTQPTKPSIHFPSRGSDGATTTNEDDLHGPPPTWRDSPPPPPPPPAHVPSCGARPAPPPPPGLPGYCWQGLLLPMASTGAVGINVGFSKRGCCCCCSG